MACSKAMNGWRIHGRQHPLSLNKHNNVRALYDQHWLRAFCGLGAGLNRRWWLNFGDTIIGNLFALIKEKKVLADPSPSLKCFNK